jgi:transposase InsO family protein
VYTLIRERASVQGELSISEMCQQMEVSRLSFYRFWERSAPAEADTQMRERLHQLSLAHPYYGYRRLTQQLRRDGQLVNAKRVLRLMQEDNLLALRRNKYVLTTKSTHDGRYYPNLVPELTLNDINQLWVADITYIRLREQFVYLAVILDAYSRRVIGWALEPHLAAELPLAALRQALAQRVVSPALVHHSDRGTQYCAGDYVALLNQFRIRISMSRSGCPYDNARAESFMKTLKSEQIDGRCYRDLTEVRTHLTVFLERVYNSERLHSALRYRPPVEFEASLRSTGNRECSA